MTVHHVLYWEKAVRVFVAVAGAVLGQQSGRRGCWLHLLHLFLLLAEE